MPDKIKTKNFVVNCNHDGDNIKVWFVRQKDLNNNKPMHVKVGQLEEFITKKEIELRELGVRSKKSQ